MIGSLLAKRQNLTSKSFNKPRNKRDKKVNQPQLDNYNTMEIEEEDDDSLTEAYSEYLDSINKREVRRLIHEYNLCCRYNRVMLSEIKSVDF